MKQDTLDKLVSRLDHLSPEELRSVFMRLVSEKGLLQDIFDALREGIILFDPAGNARFANKAAAGIYARFANCCTHPLKPSPAAPATGRTSATAASPSPETCRSTTPSPATITST